MIELHPVMPFLLAAALLPFVSAPAQRALSLLAPLGGTILVLLVPEGTRWGIEVLGFELVFLRVDALARLFALAFAGFACVAAVYAWREERTAVRAAGLGLAGSGVGAALAGDFLALFLFWEGLTLGSLFLIWSGGTRTALAAGLRYLYFHVAGAACLLAGVLLHAHESGSTAIEAIGLRGAAGWLILAGMAVNAAIPPLHAWLPDAYPRSTPAGTVFLSAYTTKAAVYALARCFPGEEFLVGAGIAMALYGVIFAVLENDIRRLLGYHIISQVGYMVCGVGLGTALALNGTAAHAFSHIFYKGLLLMAAGAVIHATGRAKLTELGGLGRWMPVTLACYAVGAFSISGVPLFSGFVSKSMIVGAAGAEGRWTGELLLEIASMGTFLHTGLKLPWFTFFGGAPAPARRRDAPASMIAAMVLAAAVCVTTGVSPEVLYAMLPHAAFYEPFTAEHIMAAIQLLLGTALGFWLLRAKLGGEPTVTRDVDRLYRRPTGALLEALGRTLEAFAPMSERSGAAFRHGWRRWRESEMPATVGFQAAVLLGAMLILTGFVLALNGRLG
ncbi:MAG: Na(+)/H(+) antiporter subunit D [Planctomycetes bacterium]|nr:Na(+)/H(+) antiporter subunit D [Planctomycetota bacterium]